MNSREQADSECNGYIVRFFFHGLWVGMCLGAFLVALFYQFAVRD